MKRISVQTPRISPAAVLSALVLFGVVPFGVTAAGCVQRFQNAAKTAETPAAPASPGMQAGLDRMKKNADLAEQRRRMIMEKVRAKRNQAAGAANAPAPSNP